MVQATLSEIIRFDHLLAAYAKVKRNRGGAGGDGVTLQDFDKDHLERLKRLKADIVAGSYWPAPLRHIRVSKTNGGWRPLSIPSIGDRVLQTAIALKLTPLLDKTFEPSSYGYQPNRSVAMAVSRVAHLRRDGFKWTVDADIERFFECVPHAPLLRQLEKLVDDGGIVDLISLWLDHGVEGEVGLPQGSPLSPLLSNVYLDELDEQIGGKDSHLVRFADDFVILCRSEKAAGKALTDVMDILEPMGLSLNLSKTDIKGPDESVHFLGKLYYRSLVLDAELNSEDDVASIVEAVPAEVPVPDALLEPERLDSERSHRYAPHLRTLYVLEEGASLSADGPHFVCQVNGHEAFRQPAQRVDVIEIGPRGDINASALRLAAATETDVLISDGWGHAATRLDSGVAGSGQRHLKQATLVLDEKLRLDFACEIVTARLHSQRTLLRRLNRRRKREAISRAASQIGNILRRLPKSDAPAALMGHEGRAAALYWPALGLCLEHGWTFNKRVRRPPPDAVNLVLSFLSTRLTQDLDVLVRRRGLHPGFGVLHETAITERGTVALDLIEIFRAPLVEGLMVYLFNNQILKETHFEMTDDKSLPVRMTTTGARALVRGYENWLDRPIRSPFSEENGLWRSLLDDQIMAFRFAVDSGEVMQTYRMDH